MSKSVKEMTLKDVEEMGYSACSLLQEFEDYYEELESELYIATQNKDFKREEEILEKQDVVHEIIVGIYEL